MKKVNLLSRAEMRKVTGGYAAAPGCSAKCPGKADAVCSKDPCQAEDGVGCIADGGKESVYCKDIKGSAE